MLSTDGGSAFAEAGRVLDAARDYSADLPPTGTGDAAQGRRIDLPPAIPADSGLDATSTTPDMADANDLDLPVAAPDDAAIAADGASDVVRDSASTASDLGVVGDAADGARDGASPDTTSDATGAVSDAAPDTGPDAPADSLPVAPTVASICAESVRGGASLVIRGSGSSAAPSNNTISFAGTTVTPISAQTDTLVVQTPASVVAGALTVTVGGLTSNGLTYRVGPLKGNLDGAGADLTGVPLGLARSADGRMVAPTMQIGGRSEIALRDRIGGTTTHLTAAGGVAPDGDMNNPQLSADGRWLGFDSSATNLVPGDNNAVADVFLYQIDTGEITRISTGLGRQVT